MEKKKAFRTPYGERERHFIPSGTGMEDTWGYEIDIYGRKVLVKTGEKDLYAEIQSHVEECKLENILNRAMAGDTSGLTATGEYMDTTIFPNSLIEARKQMQQLENTWANVPAEIKAKYHNDVEEFIGAAGSDSWLIDMGLMEAGDKSPITKTEKQEEGNVVQEFGEVTKEGQGVLKDE